MAIVAVVGLARSLKLFWQVIKLLIRLGAFFQVDICTTLQSWFDDVHFPETYAGF